MITTLEEQTELERFHFLKVKKTVDDQTSVVVCLVVGDARKPEARQLLDDLHETEAAAKKRMKEHEDAGLSQAAAASATPAGSFSTGR